MPGAMDSNLGHREVDAFVNARQDVRDPCLDLVGVATDRADPLEDDRALLTANTKMEKLKTYNLIKINMW